MWQVKTFKTRDAMLSWLERHPSIQWHEVFVNNAYGVEWRPLRRIG